VLGNKTATELTDISHEEKAYSFTEDSKIIEYELAKYLNIKD